MIKLSHEVSLAELFDGVDKSGAAAGSPDLEEMAFLLCRGGWPAACDLKGDVALNRAFSYKAVIRTSDTRYFTDPSMAAASLGVGPEDLLNDVKTFGLLFETMAVRDLRVYAQALNGAVAHYLDAGGLECDAVVHLRNGRYGLVEIKLGGKELIEKGARTLCKLAERINTVRMEEPSFKMVLTATGEYAYRRPDDGVIVCPLSALRP